MTTWRQALDIGGLSAIAVAYPLFDVLSQSPEFFVARNSTIAHVVTFTCIVSLVVPALLFGVSRTAARIRPGAELPGSDNPDARELGIRVLGAYLLDSE